MFCGKCEKMRKVRSKNVYLCKMEDVRKYAEGMDQARILNVFNRIAPQLAKENKKFQISKVASGTRFRDYRECVEWLQDAGIVNICYCLEFPELPLNGNYDMDKYKLYFADTGLLVSLLDEEAGEDSTLEQDFFIRNKDFLIPVEVKAREGRSKSLRALIDSEKYSDIQFGVKLSMNNIGYSDSVYTFPYFCAFLLKRFMKKFDPELK